MTTWVANMRGKRQQPNIPSNINMTKQNMDCTDTVRRKHLHNFLEDLFWVCLARDQVWVCAFPKSDTGPMFQSLVICFGTSAATFQGFKWGSAEAYDPLRLNLLNLVRSAEAVEGMDEGYSAAESRNMRSQRKVHCLPPKAKANANKQTKSCAKLFPNYKQHSKLHSTCCTLLPKRMAKPVDLRYEQCYGEPWASKRLLAVPCSISCTSK